MKNYIIILSIILFTEVAYAACTADTTYTYVSCKAGYYLMNGKCHACPNIIPGGDTVTPTSPDKNTNGIDDCYVNQTKTYTNTIGTYQQTTNCTFSGCGDEYTCIGIDTESDGVYLCSESICGELE